MMLEGDFSYSKQRVTGDVTQCQCVQREVTAKQGCTLREMK